MLGQPLSTSSFRNLASKRDPNYQNKLTKRAMLRMVLHRAPSWHLRVRVEEKAKARPQQTPQNRNKGPEQNKQRREGQGPSNTQEQKKTGNRHEGPNKKHQPSEGHNQGNPNDKKPPKRPKQTDREQKDNSKTTKSQDTQGKTEHAKGARS